MRVDFNYLSLQRIVEYEIQIDNMSFLKDIQHVNG